MSWPPTLEDRFILACAQTAADVPAIRALATQDPDWTVLLRKVERWRLATAVYVNAKNLPELPKAIADRLRPLHHREAIYAIARRDRLRVILLRLSEAHIAVLVPPPTSDADLLVRAPDRDRAAAMARDIARPGGGGRLSIRANVATLAAAGIPIEDLWTRSQRGRIESVETLVPSPEDVVLQLALDLAAQLANPHNSGDGLRALCALGSACPREGNAIDWPGLVTRAYEHDVAASLARALYLARDLVAADVPSAALEALTTAMPLADRSATSTDTIYGALFSENADAAPAMSDVVRAATSPAMHERSSGETVAAVAVTYDPMTTDGVGSQLLRIYGLYALSRALQVQYVHTPIALVGYQGFLPLLTGRHDADSTARYNAFFTLPSDDFDLASCRRVPIHVLTREIVEEHQRLASASGHSVLLQAIHHYGYTDRHPATFHALRAISPYREFRASGPIRVCIHVRRGDNSVPGRTDVDQRLLPNSYYLRVCGTLLEALRREGVPFVVRLHTEVPTRPCTIYPDTPGLYFRLDEPSTVEPSGYALDEFDALPNLEMCLNLDAREVLDDFATADVLILSRSSLGYVAGLLNPHGVVVYAPWWHPALPGWLVADEHGHLDAAQVGTRISEHLRRR